MKTFAFSLSLLALSQTARAAITGTQNCASFICVTARHDSSTNRDTYTLTPPADKKAGRSDFGWMAIGFGTQMSDAAIVMAWPNSDGSITLTQRKAPGHVAPSLDSNPPRVAALNTTASFSDSTTTSITFSLPSNEDTIKNSTSLIWAYSSSNPGSSSPTARFAQHDIYGFMQLALMTPLTDGSVSSNPSPSGSGSAPGSSSSSVPNSSTFSSSGPSDAALRAHIICGALAALLIFPIGALVPRCARAVTNSRAWFPVHAAVNGVVGTALVIAAFAIARSQFSRGFISTHRRLGLTLLIMCLLQVGLGLVAHYVKFTLVKHSSGRGISHFAHLLLGLVTIVIGYATVWTGMDDEYPAWSGYGPVSSGWKAGYGVVVGAFALLYILGVVFGLPRQLRRERERGEAAEASANGSGTPPQIKSAQ